MFGDSTTVRFRAVLIKFVPGGFGTEARVYGLGFRVLGAAFPEPRLQTCN